MRNLCILLSCVLCALPGVLKGQLAQYAEIPAPSIPISFSFEKPILERAYSLCLDDVSADVCYEENDKNWYIQLTGLPFYTDFEGKRVEAKLLQSSKKICTKYRIGSDALLKQYRYLFQLITHTSYTDCKAFIIDQYEKQAFIEGAMPRIEGFWDLLANRVLSIDLDKDNVLSKVQNFFAAMLIKDCVCSDDIRKRICEGLAQAGLLTKDEQIKLGMSTQRFTAIALANTGTFLDSHNKPYTFIDTEAEVNMIARFRKAFLEVLDEEGAKAAKDLFLLPTHTPAFTIVPVQSSTAAQGEQHLGLHSKNKKPDQQASVVQAKTVLMRFWESSWRAPTLLLCAVGAMCYFAKKSDPRNWRLSGWLKPVQDRFARFGVNSFFSRAPSIRAMSAANSFE